MPSTVRSLPVVVVLGGLVLGAGCSPLDVRPPTAWFADDDASGPAAHLVAVWTDGTYQPPGRLPIRGFGGRLMFYGPRSDKPVKVDGGLVIYAFDENEPGRDPSELKPTRKYVFTRQQLAKRYSKSKLGHAYSVWIPWDEVGGLQKEISLIARLVPADGPTVLGRQAKVILPGKAPARARDGLELTLHDTGGRPGREHVRPVMHQTLSPTTVEAEQLLPEARSHSSERMRTTTISIPPNFGRITPIAQTQFRRSRPQAGQDRPRQAIRTAAPSSPHTATTTGLAEMPPAGQQAAGPSVDYRLDPPPAPVGPATRRLPDGAPWQPPPAGPQSALPSTRRSATAPEYGTSLSAARPGSY